MTLTGTVWAPIGPSPIAQGGRQDNGLVSAIAISPVDSNVIYIGTAGGGVWHTIDAGAHWTPIFDRQISLGIGEPAGIAIDPNDTSTIYVGTSSRVTPQRQAGLYKSTDGGASCIRLGSGYPTGNTGNASQFFGQSINVIIVDPADSRIVYLASNVGMFRSTDGGENWTQGAGSGGDVRALVLDPTSPAGARRLYAGITSRGVFQSTNGGANWNPILTAATPVVATALGGAPGAGIGKAIVDLAPPTSPPNSAGIQVLYASLQGTGGAPDVVGLFLSTNQGVNWTQRAAAGMPSGTQGGYSFHFAVDPGSPGDGANDRIFFGVVGQARSTNSGASFTGLSGLHADTHAWAFVRQPSPTPSTVYCGNDGGIFRSTDGGNNWSGVNGGGLQTGLFYNLTVKPDTTASATLGALQDNGLQTTAGAASPGWSSPQGGDGWDVEYDGVTGGRVYGTSGFWSPAPCTRVWRSNNDGTSWPTEITPWGTATDAGCYLAPITTDPSTAGIVYASGNQNLWQSRDGGGTWRNLGAFSGRPSVAPANGNNVVVARGNQVFVSTNALAATVGAPSGVTFTNITRNLPPRNVQRVAFDPNDPQVIYAVLGGFDGGGQNGHVFRTTVGGTAWRNISPALNVPFGALALDGADTPTSIYVGTDLGVLRSVDGGASWTVLDDVHFPHAPVTDLVLSRQAGILRAATYGRGVFEFRRPTGPVIAVDLEHNLDFGTVCDGPVYLTLRVYNVGVTDLVIKSVQRLMGSTGISVLPTPGLPLVLAPGEEIDFTIAFSPTTPGLLETATIRIASNDPDAPVVDLAATGTGGVPALELVLPDRGDFGKVCVGSFVDRGVVINNRGPCPLGVSGIGSSSPEFVPPGVSFYPLVVGSGDSIEVPIRFEPTSFGAKSATLTVTSNDPGGPRTLALSGTAPSGHLIVTGSGHFGPVDLGRRAERTISICNTGECDLHVTKVGFKADPWKPGCRDYDDCEEHDHHEKHNDQCCGRFKLVTNPFPAMVAPGSCLGVLIRFTPSCLGPQCCELVIESDDPGVSEKTVYVTGRLHRTLSSALKCWAAEELRELIEAGEEW
jgi:photosystem II stability/assembly factor-like uncharacterized protein